VFTITINSDSCAYEKNCGRYTFMGQFPASGIAGNATRQKSTG